MPRADRSHPLGCHRPRVCDRLCFRGLLNRLVTGVSWTDIETILERRVSDTTLRARRDEWIAAGGADLTPAAPMIIDDRGGELSFWDKALRAAGLMELEMGPGVPEEESNKLYCLDFLSRSSR